MKKRVFSLLMALLMVITMFPTSAIAVGTGTQQDPYQVGDTVTNDGSAEPEGAKAENTYWARTADVAAVRTTVCQTEEHDHVAAGCTAAIETVACLLEGHPAEGETSFTHEDGTVCAYDGENAQWLTNVEAGYTCGIEAHTHTVEAGCITEVPGYTVWTLTENTQNPPPSNNSLSTLELDQSQNSRAAAGALPIHFFLASPGNITNPEGSYTDYYVPLKDSDNAAWTIGNIKTNAAWSTINTQDGIRNASVESDVTKYVASWPENNDPAAFKDFGSVRIDGITYNDTDYEIKWVSIMSRHNTQYNAQNNIGMCCGQYYSYKNEHIHIDGLLVQKIEPGEMEVYKAIPAAAEVDTTFHFTLQKMLQPNLTSAPTSADAIDTSFSPMTLTATISAGETEAQITGGSEISFGYYKLTENASTNWENNGIVLTDSRGRTQTVDTDTLYICIAPKGDVLYSTTPNGTYTAMNHVAVQNKRKGVNVTYEWKAFNADGSITELPAGAPAVPASESGEYGSQYVYNTSYVDGTSFSDYDNGLLYTFCGWDTYSHSNVFNVVPTVAGYTALDDGDSVASNNKTIPLTENTYIYGYWEVSQMPPASAHIAVEKVFVLDGTEVPAAELENSPIKAAKSVWFQVDPGIDLDGDGVSRVDIDYSMIQADPHGKYKLPVFQYAAPYTFTENNADIPGYTRTTTIKVDGDNAVDVTPDGAADVYAEVKLTEVYQGTNVPLGTIIYTNSYTKNLGTPVSEYPELTLVKHAADTGNLQADAVFTLYSDAACQNAVGTYTTGDDGTVTIDFKEIEATNDGKYYLKETTAPAGYLVDNTVYTLTLTSTTQEELRGNEFVNVTTYALAISVPADSDAEAIQSAADEMQYSLNVFNSPILGQVTVKKESTGLEAADKDLMKATLTVHGPITRDAQGKITALGSEYTLILDKDNEWTAAQTQLSIGEYLIHENMASVHGYTWDMDEVDYGGLTEEIYNGITSGIFQVKADSTDIQVTVTNTYTPWATADFYIYKTDPTGAHLGGATFQLYADEACTVKVTDPAITTNAVTATNGIAWFHGYTVPADDADGIVTYYLQETIAPAGHYLSDTVYKVDIKSVDGASGTTFEPKISVKVNGNWVEAPGFDSASDELPVVNEPVKGQLTITKNMVGAPVDLTSVTVYVSGPNHYAKTVTLTKDNQWKETLNNLPLGTYTVTEQDAGAPGYDLVTTYTVDGNVTNDKATVILKETVPGLTQSGTVFAGTASVTNTYTKREETVENPTSLTVKKVGENGEALAGAEFTLTRLKDDYAQEHSVVFTTGTNGTVTFSFLTGSLANGAAIDGKYTLTETKAPAGYAKSNTVWNITVKEKDGQVTIKLNEDKNVWENIWDWIVGGVNGEQDTYTWENNLLTVKNVELADLTISKLFAHETDETKDIKPADGAIIEVAVFDSANKLVEQVELTAENQWSVTLNNLPADTYTIRENSPSLHGYTWKRANFAVSINEDLQNNLEGDHSSVKVAVNNSDIVNVNIVNYYTEWTTADFYVMKVDADGNPLQNAEFQLFEGNQNVTEKYLHIAADIHTGKLNDAKDGGVTGTGGILHFHGFEVDESQTKTFTLIESIPPENYYVNENKYAVTISHDAEGYHLSVTETDPNASFNTGNDVLTVVNKEILANLTIEKTFAEGGLTPNSVMVKVTGPKDYENTVVLGVNNGYKVTLEDLPLGQYTVKELDAAHDGYALTVQYNGVIANEGKITLTEANDTTAAEMAIHNIYVLDKHNPASFTIKKVDANNPNKLLEGAVFGLYDSDGNLVGGELTTDQNGEVTVNIEKGPAVYTLKEIQAPANYEKTDATWTVTVTDEDGQPRVEVENNLNTNIWDWIVDIITGQTTAAWENNVLTVPNTIKLGELVISKALRGDDGHYADAEYSFTLDCSNDAFDQTFKLKADESKTIANIPWGTTYTLTEETANAAFRSQIDHATGTIQSNEFYVNVTNTYEIVENNPGLNLVKVDADTGRPIKNVRFELYYDEACTNYANSGTTDENGKVNIPVHFDDHATYYLKEVAPAAGYYPNTTVYKVTAETKYVVHNAGEANAYTEKQQILTVEGLSEPTVDANNAISYTYKVKNTAIKPVTITATKVWNDGGYYARPENVTVTLYKDGEAYDIQKLNAANGWTYTWSGADFTDEYDWTVDEKVADVPAGYVKSVTNDGDDWTLTNTRAPKSVEISVTKAWKHNGGKDLPESIKVTLYKDGEAYETVTLSEANGWSHKWTGLTDVSQWSIDETDVPAGYTKDITVDGYKFTVTNTRTILPVEVSVTKVWDAPEGITVPESVEVVLYRDGEKFDTVKLAAKDNWTHTWKDLTDEYTWSVDEASVPAGYTKNVTASDTDFTIINSLNYKQIDVSVKKVWEGANVTHPASVEVTLYRDGEKFDTVKLSADNNWQYVWEDLADVFTWTVDEVSVPADYTKTVTANGTDFTITNSLNYNFIDVSVEKVWYGTNVTHPSSVDVTLFRNGVAFDTVELSAANGWKHVWKDLTDDYVWAVDETVVPSGYNKTVKENADHAFVITNTHQDIPKTGDENNLTGMIVLCVIGVLGFLAAAFLLFIPRKKGKYEK